jgi:hypothetical protein
MRLVLTSSSSIDAHVLLSPYPRRTALLLTSIILPIVSIPHKIHNIRIKANILARSAWSLRHRYPTHTHVIELFTAHVGMKGSVKVDDGFEEELFCAEFSPSYSRFRKDYLFSFVFHQFC